MKKLFFILSFLVFVPTARAQMDCEEVPSCAELGYTQDSCAGGKGVRCPFDESKFYCAGVKQLPDAENPGVTDENWTAKCADKINYCTAYNTECQCTACEDTYLISDGACVPECDKSADTCAAESKVFNAETCTCEACPTNYQFNSETKACEQIACDKTKVEHCATYSSEYEPCTCQTCDTDYLLDEGVCKKMCTIVANCKTYDSDYDPCTCTACEDGFNLKNGKCLSGCAEKCIAAYPIFAGQDNTTAAIADLGENAIAAYVTRQFYVGDKNGDFGQGKWYLPSIGELMYTYGTDVAQITKGVESKKKGSVEGAKEKLIDAALTTLYSKGVNASYLLGEDIHSSTVLGQKTWYYSSDISYTQRQNGNTSSGHFVRCFLILKDLPNTENAFPKIGDVVYTDKSFGSANDYDKTKIIAGIVTAVSDTGKDVTIMNVKSLKFSGNTAESFNPDDPYTARPNSTQNLNPGYRVYWKPDSLWGYAPKVQNISEDDFVTYAQASDNCPCQLYEPDCKLNAAICAAESKLFDEASCSCKPCDAGYIFANGVCVVDPCVAKCKIAYPLFNGRDNTKAAVNQIGKNAMAAYAANQFYVGDKTGDFGQGNWYLPSIGEWMYLYGTDVTKITSFRTSSGANGANKNLINTALTTLLGKGVEAQILKNPFSSNNDYWSSSEKNSGSVWQLNTSTGQRSYHGKNTGWIVRASALVTDFSNSGTDPQIGDVMYEDKTYGAASAYDGSKTPVGIIAAVSTNKRDVMIISLENLTFSSTKLPGNFDPENPYNSSCNLNPSTGRVCTTLWGASEDVTEIPNFEDENNILEVVQASGNCPCQFYLPKVEDTCTGANKCKDSFGNCVPCYSSCSAYNSNYTDTKPSGYTCSSAPVMIGSGNGATSAYKTCYYNCTCEGSDKCRYGNRCVTCYASCSDFSSTYQYEEGTVPDGYNCKRSAALYLGSGNGTSARAVECYGDCKHKCDYEHGCKDADGGCVSCYVNCQDYSHSEYDEPVEGKECVGPNKITVVRPGSGSEIIMQGEGYAAPVIGPLKCYLCY